MTPTMRATMGALPVPPGSARRKRSWPRRRISSRLGGCDPPPPPRPQGLGPPPQGPPPPLPPPWFCHGIRRLLYRPRAQPCQPPASLLSPRVPHRSNGHAHSPDRGAVGGGSQGREESMSDVSEQQVLAALRQVIDPDQGKDIVALGMISGVQMREGHVAFAIEVEPSRGPNLEPLRRAAEKAVQALPGILSVSAVLTAQKAPT